MTDLAKVALALDSDAVSLFHSESKKLDCKIRIWVFHRLDVLNILPSDIFIHTCNPK